MTFPIDTTIPNGPNDPADDQNDIRSNFVNINSYLSVDHVAPGAINNGVHAQVTYNSIIAPAAPPGGINGPYGIAYAGAGVSVPSVAENFFRNTRGIFPMSAIKAFGMFISTAANGVIALNTGNTFNVVSITGSGFPNMSPQYRVVLETNAINGDLAAVFINTNTLVSANDINYALANPNLDILMRNSSTAGNVISFMVVQI